jgi:hypothetical protein
MMGFILLFQGSVLGNFDSTTTAYNLRLGMFIIGSVARRYLLRTTLETNGTTSRTLCVLVCVIIKRAKPTPNPQQIICQQERLTNQMIRKYHHQFHTDDLILSSTNVSILYRSHVSLGPTRFITPYNILRYKWYPWFRLLLFL